jgi:hypothetical protein
VSCATHRLDGGVAVELTISDKDGNILQEMQN